MVSVISVENPELPYTAGPTQLSFVSPATVKSTRGTHSSNCDWDAHGGCSSSSSSSLHDRRPLEGFSGCPSAVDLSSILGFEDVGNKSLLLMGDAMDDCLVVSGPYGSMGMADSFTDELVRDTPVVSFDDLIVSSDSTHNFLPMVVPPLPKNRKSACGKHKEEILRQLCKLAKLERSLSSENGVVESFLGLQPSVQERSFQTGYVDTGIEHGTGPTLAPGFDVNAFQWHGDYSEAADQVPILITFPDNRSEENFLVLGEPGEDGSSGSHTNVGCKEQSQHLIIRESLQGLQKVGQHEPTRIDRDLAISRYKEKKKARRYNKHIWYESRNVRAEGRTRIKGRFAKAND
ncbi:PREDICTED: zinc finger protein CONSTANS-LIKE 13-like isoform X2 [Nelumbo nucifera]|uniref:Zinc finger protein CONSTANS-LIKE 13-like isoform X2 n=1 Tax=Nelumbo nucifera TaxID=4432 RepID=A0A1U7Z3Q9_NELNU|nr:PREDICTED: zinc finger protein CONSTANS-LIKE 13-like isoform X2 [Nelumbo nucifera]